MSKVEFIPEPFFRKLFEYYGTNVSSFVMLSGVVISGFGLEKLINPTVWLIAAVCAMVLAFSIRSYVSARYILVLVLGSFIFVLTAFGLVYLETENQLLTNLSTPIHSHAAMFLIFLFFTATICIIFISYKKYSANIESDLPSEIIDSVRKYVCDVPILYDSFYYEIDLYHKIETNEVSYDMAVSFIVKNRTGMHQTFVSRYPTPSESFLLRSAVVNGEALDLENPTLYSNDAIVLRIPITPKNATSIAVRMTKTFSCRESDIFTAYELPAREFRIRVSNHSNRTLTCWIEPLHNQNVPVKREGNLLEWVAQDAILPNQGVRALWRTRDE